jgi:hypothetical protein
MSFPRRCHGVVWTSLVVLAVVSTTAMMSCGGDETPKNVNLLKNSSFEEVENGMPKHWTLDDFRGLEGEPEVQYRIDSEAAADGQNSWQFAGDPATRRWLVLKQEVEVKNISHVRLEGWRQTDQVVRGREQHSHCNFALTFFDENHNRFQELRLIDRKTPFTVGTNPWFEENLVFKVPEGTRFIAVSCILACQGTAWFDNVRLSATMTLNWQTRQTRNFVFHWVPEKPFPAGSIENQQRLFDHYASRLGIESGVVVGYYLYPDSATIRKIMDISGDQYISYTDKEVHTVNPNENHEIIHLMTDDYGVPSRAILEGTVFWLHGEWGGELVHAVAARHLAAGDLPTLEEMFEQDKRVQLDYRLWMPAAASFIGFLVDVWGPERLLELYKAPTGQTSYAPFARAFEKVYGTPCEEVEKEWHSALAEFEQMERIPQEQQ